MKSLFPLTPLALSHERWMLCQAFSSFHCNPFLQATSTINKNNYDMMLMALCDCQKELMEIKEIRLCNFDKCYCYPLIIKLNSGSSVF